ncbi:hypothetical protein COCSUDRAFT_56328 [Coccomyxa subellipsoidea C-169]|uniref:Uncharacterized protein n=1 Tax=Coccomyxa subellipsoidea (strain C-169) TaxID=574566 RepID=I0YU12_COCSC|nr:hypothetical protein COCSUDRAFT_56328 [Coccomyxa subellipsoidea C-169]EIE21881.1 hypothetical protein COCSUDRAFT_56328 [Coccomyxa subellipsoidea C-169]|eukprot:XP_005646425.1 hypothetical protein COCSUDRAFT_56328 [Coccomyxa subellipsoidea C-169]
MGHLRVLLLSLAALLLLSAPAHASRELQQSEVKVCRYACGMGLTCMNGVCSATTVNDLSSASPDSGSSPAMSAEPASPAPSDSPSLAGERQSSVAVGRSPVPLESHSDEENQDRFSAAQAASMSFIDTNMDTATIALSPGNSPAPGVVSVVVIGPTRGESASPSAPESPSPAA